MADFNRFLPRLLKFEGGFVDNPADPGGVTNKGVTLQTFRACSQDLLGLAPVLDNLRSLTDAQAGVIYKRLYWDRLHADDIRFQELAELLVDFHVNAGAKAVCVLQAVLNDIDARRPLSVDGAMGAATLRALLDADQPALFVRLRAARVAYYTDLAARCPALRQFLKGWLRRANSFEATP